MKQTFILIHDTARQRALEAVKQAQEGFVVTVGERTRNLEQSARFHAICGDFAKSGIKWAGKERSAGEWKILLISGHSVATGQGAEIIPGLENEFVNIRESSARMGKARASSLIEYSEAMLADKSQSSPR